MDALDQIRAFNRANLHRIGRVEAAYADIGLTTPEARVLIELEAAPGVTARRLAERLALNEGYVSRLISGLERRGWLSRDVSARDRRLRQLRLTDAGAAKSREIAAASRRQIASWLVAPDAAQSVAAHLVAAESGLSNTGVIDTPEAVTLDGLRPGDIGWLTEQHAIHYAASDGFDAQFEPLVARILADFAEGNDPACERAWIARRGAARLGSIFCVKGPAPDTAKLRLFFLMPQARGLGLGKRMLATCIRFAKAAGYHRMQLWTHESHRAACALYEQAGFTCDTSKPVTSFGVDLVEQQWSLDLLA